MTFSVSMDSTYVREMFAKGGKYNKNSSGFPFGTLKTDYIHVTSIICFAKINNASEKPCAVTVNAEGRYIHVAVKHRKCVIFDKNIQNKWLSSYLFSPHTKGR